MDTFLFCFLVLVSLNGIACITKVEYLDKLINQENAKSLVSAIPTNSAEFKEDVDSTTITNYGTYDFIIVGAGSAGSVLATRLSEISSWKILLLEAGGEETDFSEIPSVATTLLFDGYTWPYYSTPQNTSCLGMINRQCASPRGKVVGGSSGINGVMYTRGNPYDYDNWVQLGNPGWSFEEVFPYFIKSENSQIDGDPGYHGVGGLWNVQYSQSKSGVFEKFVAAANELNQTVLDYNGQNQMGLSRIQLNIKHGVRQSTGTAFLDNGRQRRNLKVLTKTLATKVRINKKTKVAQGVEFVRKNSKFRANARVEVILSAGVFNTPQLLILSGIGPQEHLQELGINVIQDLPVGQSLIDQPFLSGFTFRTNYTNTETLEEAIKTYVKGIGTLTRGWGAEVLGFIHAGDVPETVPMLEYILVPPNSTSAISARFFNFNQTLVDNYLNILNPKTDFAIYLALLHPKSRSTLTLNSTDPTDFPILDLNLLSEQEDVDNLIEGVKFLLRLSETEGFKQLNATLIELPVCQDLKSNFTSYWTCVLRTLTTSWDHTAGSTPMGPNSTTSVVDSNLNVYGIRHLRVVDASILPSSISGHTNAPTIMIAEKISDVIKTAYNAI